MRFLRRILCVLIAGAVLFTAPAFAYGETEEQPLETEVVEEAAPAVEEPTIPDEVSPPDPALSEIVSFDPLSGAISNQSMVVHGRIGDLVFPTTLQAKNGNGETITINNVTWTPNKPFSKLRADVFYYTPTIPSEYTVQEGISLPKITINVNRRVTYVTGITKTYNKTATGTTTDTITIYPSDGRVVYLQYWTGSKWVTKQTYKTQNAYKTDITIGYTKEWYENAKSTWRIYIPQSPQGLAFTQKVTMTVARKYQPPIGYRQIQDAIPTRTSSYSLSVGMSGLKVNVVNKRLGIGGKAYYSTTTKNAVIAFQKRYGLKPTGVVDYTTWKKMGYSWKNWCYLDSYVTPNTVPRNATKSAYVERIVSTAQKYMGDPYVWCASGRVTHGVDCTGLVFQSLYSVGIDPLPIGSHVYAYNANQYSSRKLAALSGFYKPSFANRKRGDIIAYGSPVFHVAIYIGNNKIIEAAPGYGVRTNSVYAYPIHSVLRPIV